METYTEGEHCDLLNRNHIGIDHNHKMMSIWVTTNLHTRFAFSVSACYTVRKIKEKIEEYHSIHFPKHGKVLACDLLVKKKSKLYHIVDWMCIKDVFATSEGATFLQVELCKVAENIERSVSSLKCMSKQILDRVKFRSSTREQQNASAVDRYTVKTVDPEMVQLDNDCVERPRKIMKISQDGKYFSKLSPREEHQISSKQDIITEKAMFLETLLSDDCYIEEQRNAMKFIQNRTVFSGPQAFGINELSKQQQSPRSHSLGSEKVDDEYPEKGGYQCYKATFLWEPFSKQKCSIDGETAMTMSPFISFNANSDNNFPCLLSSEQNKITFMNKSLEDYRNLSNIVNTLESAQKTGKTTDDCSGNILNCIQNRPEKDIWKEKLFKVSETGVFSINTSDDNMLKKSMNIYQTTLDCGVIGLIDSKRGLEKKGREDPTYMICSTENELVSYSCREQGNNCSELENTMESVRMSKPEELKVASITKSSCIVGSTISVGSVLELHDRTVELAEDVNDKDCFVLRVLSKRLVLGRNIVKERNRIDSSRAMVVASKRIRSTMDLIPRFFTAIGSNSLQSANNILGINTLYSALHNVYRKKNVNEGLTDEVKMCFQDLLNIKCSPQFQQNKHFVKKKNRNRRKITRTLKGDNARTEDSLEDGCQPESVVTPGFLSKATEEMVCCTDYIQVKSAPTGSEDRLCQLKNMTAPSFPSVETSGIAVRTFQTERVNDDAGRTVLALASTSYLRDTCGIGQAFEEREVPREGEWNLDSFTVMDFACKNGTVNLGPMLPKRNHMEIDGNPYEKTPRESRVLSMIERSEKNENRLRYKDTNSHQIEGSLQNKESTHHMECSYPGLNQENSGNNIIFGGPVEDACTGDLPDTPHFGCRTTDETDGLMEDTIENGLASFLNELLPTLGLGRETENKEKNGDARRFNLGSESHVPVSLLHAEHEEQPAKEISFTEAAIQQETEKNELISENDLINKILPDSPVRSDGTSHAFETAVIRKKNKVKRVTSVPYISSKKSKKADSEVKISSTRTLPKRDKVKASFLQRNLEDDLLDIVNEQSEQRHKKAFTSENWPRKLGEQLRQVKEDFSNEVEKVIIISIGKDPKSSVCCKYCGREYTGKTSAYYRHLKLCNHKN